MLKFAHNKVLKLLHSDDRFRNVAMAVKPDRCDENYMDCVGFFLDPPLLVRRALSH